MSQRFMRSGRWMSLEQAQAFDKERRGLNKEAPEVEKEAVATKPTATEVVAASDEAPIIGALKNMCTEKGIKFHHRAGVAKLQELLSNAEKSV